MIAQFQKAKALIFRFLSQTLQINCFLVKKLGVNVSNQKQIQMNISLKLMKLSIS